MMFNHYFSPINRPVWKRAPNKAWGARASGMDHSLQDTNAVPLVAETQQTQRRCVCWMSSFDWFLFIRWWSEFIQATLEFLPGDWFSKRLKYVYNEKFQCWKWLKTNKMEKHFDHKLLQVLPLDQVKLQDLHRSCQPQLTAKLICRYRLSCRRNCWSSWKSLLRHRQPNNRSIGVWGNRMLM